MLRKVRKRVAEVVRVYVQRDEMFRDRKLGNFTALDDQSLTQPPKEHRFPASARTRDDGGNIQRQNLRVRWNRWYEQAAPPFPAVANHLAYLKLANGRSVRNC
jgi:hypothetical protein